MKLFFCSILLCAISTTSFASMSRGVSSVTKKGEIIAVNTDQAIADHCDFSQQIVVTQTNVLCVYTGK